MVSEGIGVVDLDLVADLEVGLAEEQSVLEPVELVGFVVELDDFEELELELEDEIQTISAIC